MKVLTHNIRQEREDQRDRSAQLFMWCIVVSMHQDDGIGASRVALLAEGVDRNMRKLTREHWRTAQDRVAESYKDRFGKCIGEKCMAYENGRCKRLEREGTQ